MPKTSLRKEAEGRECQIRIPGVCNGNNKTVVLCHIHKASISGGMGLKANDVLAAHGCSNCHDVVDHRKGWGNAEGYLSPEDIRLMFYEGIFRTQKILLDEGRIGELL